MLLGFAITEHCNLRCPHCIRDDVTTVRSLDVSFVTSVLDQALAIFPEVTVSLTGGEPLIHPKFDDIVRELAERGIGYRFVSNGWHMRRIARLLNEHAPQAVRLSLSGATAVVHDAERGRGSFRRVLEAVAILTSRRVFVALSLVVDKRDRDQLGTAVDLAASLGVPRLQFILPQPVPSSIARGSDLAPHDWYEVRREVERLASGAIPRLRITLDYGAPFDGDEHLCEAMRLERLYVNARGQLSVCCQLSEYGFTSTDVVADLKEETLDSAWVKCQARLATLREATWGVEPADEFDRLPCIRCARVSHKLHWLDAFPGSAWNSAARHSSLVAGPSGRHLPLST